MTDMANEIAQYLIFHDLADEYLEIMADHAAHEQYREGAIITKKGAPATTFYLITQGTVELMEEEFDSDPSLPVHFLKSGEIMGWAWLTRPYRWNFYCVAYTDAEVIRIDAERLRQQMTEDHELSYQMYSRFFDMVVMQLQNTRYFLLQERRAANAV